MALDQSSDGAPPTTDPETAPYWAALAAGRLLVKRCLACGELHHYPRALCPFCFSPRTEWVDVSGEGRVYSFSVVRRAAAPHVLAYVTLVEGPTLLTNLVDCAPEEVEIGRRVRLVVKALPGGGRAPMFTPA